MKNTSSTFLTRVRMARILFLFSVCFLSLHSYAANIGAYAQQKNLTIEMRNKTVKEVLDYIEKNSEFIFFYYSKAIDTKRIVSLSVKDQPITVILDQLFKNTDVLYEIKDRQISLKREELPTEQRPQDSKQQKRKLVGTVTDASSSDPLVGVSISVKNSPGTGTITDLDIIRKTKCSPLFKRSDISYKTKRPPKNNFPKYSRGSKKSTGKFCFSQCFFL